MAQINDTRALKFVNEQIRPLCEAARALKVRVLAMDVEWQVISALFPNDTSVVADGRESEGVSILKGSDINDVHFNLTGQFSGLTDATISKPCVRKLEAS